VASKLSLFLAELKRRKVTRVSGVYLVVGLGILGAAEVILDPLGLGALRPYVVVLVLLGFPIALVLAWAYELKPEDPRPTEPLEEEAPPGPQGSVPTTVTATEQRKSIVVLPFDNLSPDSEDSYLAEGITEEITADLTGLHSLRVISRTSAMQYKGSGKDIPTISRELSVRYVMEGSVRKAGEELKITCQLIDAANDSHLWAEKFTGAMADIFDLEERVARSVVDSLAIQLDSSEERSLVNRPIADIRAYELYLRAHQEKITVSREGMERAQRQLERALEITGENALLFGQLAQTHYQFWNMGLRQEEEDLRKARDYADRALDLNPNSADHHLMRGLLEVTGGSAVRALGHLQAALNRDPDHADSLGWYPAVAGFLGFEEKANEKLERLRRVDPLHPFAVFLPIWFELYGGRFKASWELAERVRDSQPGDVMIEMPYILALSLDGRSSDAVRIAREVLDPKRGFFERVIFALARAADNKPDEALALVDPELRRWAEKDFQYSMWMAEIFSLSGDPEEALNWLDNAADRGNINHRYIFKLDPFLVPLHSHPRWAVLDQRVMLERKEYLERLKT